MAVPSFGLDENMGTSSQGDRAAGFGAGCADVSGGGCCAKADPHKARADAVISRRAIRVLVSAAVCPDGVTTGPATQSQCPFQITVCRPFLCELTLFTTVSPRPTVGATVFRRRAGATRSRGVVTISRCFPWARHTTSSWADGAAVSRHSQRRPRAVGVEIATAAARQPSRWPPHAACARLGSSRHRARAQQSAVVSTRRSDGRRPGTGPHATPASNATLTNVRQFRILIL